MNTKRVCKELNISPKALRIYEEWEIVVAQRDENNYRNYSIDDLLKLRQVMILKELGFSLKEIKQLLEKAIMDENKLVRSLYLQLNAIENKIIELENIKLTLKENINESLLEKEEMNYSIYLDKINDNLYENKEKRSKWIDKWRFDSWAKDYDNLVKYNPVDELNLFEKYDDVLGKVKNEILKQNAKKVLDIGCGTGTLCGPLSEDIEIIGLDQSIEMILQAKFKYPNMKLKLGNFMDEPFIEKQFDMVVSTYAFHHLKPIEKEIALKLMLRYLKEKGKLVIADLMFLNEIERQKNKEIFISKKRKDLWDIIEDEYYTDIENIKRYAEFLGCIVTYEHIVNFTWMLKIEK